MPASAEALLVRLAREGDEQAFAELVKRRQSWLRNLMRRASGDPALADDLAQHALMQAWRKIGSLERPETFGAWLKRIAINTWLQHLRASDALRGAAGEEEIDAASSVDGLPEAAATPGMAIDLDRALAALPPAMRLAVVLAYHEGMTHAEIAEATGLPEGTVKSHIRRGSEKLRQMLSAYEVRG